MGRAMGRPIQVMGRSVGARFQVPDVHGQVRQRVLESLQQAVEAHPLTVLVAPAGSGKTTSLVHLARATERSHVWYRATPTQTPRDDLLGQLELAFRQVTGGFTGNWTHLEAAVDALAAIPEPPPTLLMIDDLHELADSPAEQILERLVHDLPPWLRVLVATRHRPDFNHSALRLSGDLVEITEDVLRWRPWEVERLFRDYYRMRLRPEEAARLTQRTEGWVAGLQLFHLASEHLPLAERSQLIDELHTRPGLVRDYLTQNVLAGLPDRLRSFMIDTCVLGRLDGPLCDQLRGRSGSASTLDELEHKRLFLTPREDGLGYRYHEVLRSYLEISMLERDGEMAARARFHRAGGLLERCGALPEALHAYSRAESWHDAARLLGSDGPALARGGHSILASLPPPLMLADPWLRLAHARALVGEGRLRPAIQAYNAAEAAFGPSPAAQTCRDEKAIAQPFVDVRERPPRTLADLLREALRTDPRRRAHEALATETPEGMLTAAVAVLLAGGADEARQLARRAGSDPEAEVFVIAAARALEHVAGLAGGLPEDFGDLLWAAETFEHLGSTWLARLARTVSNCQSVAGLEEVATTWELLNGDDDPWGPPLFRLVAGIAAVIHERPEPDWLDEAARSFREIGAGTMEAWARAWEALARADRDEPEPLAAAEQARSLARHAHVPGAVAVSEVAIAVADATQAQDAMARARSLSRELGLVLPALTEPRREFEVDVRGPAGSRVTCFGHLDLVIEGRSVDLSGLKPQSRTLLGLLAIRTGAPLHREYLIDALWAGEDPTAARRRLPVLVSTVRRHLEPDARPGDWSLLVRQGEAYMLQSPQDTYVDVRAFEEAASHARNAHVRRDLEAEVEAHRRVIATYGGDLLPEFGAVEWVVEEREYYRAQVIRSAVTLASWQLEGGDPSACAETVEAGLRIDRYHSQLWCLLADAHRALGDLAAATRAEQGHAAVLQELGITRTGCCPSMAPDVMVPAAPVRASVGHPISEGSATGSR